MGVKHGALGVAIVGVIAAAGCNAISGADDIVVLPPSSVGGGGALPEYPEETTASHGGGPTEMPTSTGPGGGGPTEPECPHTGDPYIDPNILNACPTSVCPGGAHCVPSNLVPADFSSMLNACDADTLCVPDPFIETNGNFIPQTCTSIAGNEGRCLSVCLPDVAEQANLLPQDVCAANEVCTPCWDPLEETETGACTLSCDPGPTTTFQPLPECCDGIGTCVPSSAVPPEDAEQLGRDVCPENDPADYLCAPNVFINDPGHVPPSCETSLVSALFGDTYKPGACLPDCLPAVDNFLLQQDDCPDNHTCAPCKEPPFGGDSGACNF